ncbi:MAG: hypothetical protein ACK40U_04625 [Fervidobacterium pennivorans]
MERKDGKKQVVKRGILSLYANVMWNCIQGLEEAEAIAKQIGMPENAIQKLAKSRQVLKDIMTWKLKREYLPNFVDAIVFLEKFRTYASIFFKDKPTTPEEEKLNRITYTALEYLFDTLRNTENETLSKIKELQTKTEKAKTELEMLRERLGLA